MNAAKMSVDEILASLEDGIRGFMESDRYRNYLRAVSRFRDYSVNNITLISMQRPDATLVAGYSTWKKSFNRNVKKGEKGIRIIAPFPVQVEREKEVFDSMGNLRTEKVTVTVPRFRAVSVFDVSQTEGDPLPDLDPGMLEQKVDDYSVFRTALERCSPVPVRYGSLEGNTKGIFDTRNKRIVVKEGMSEAQTVKTLVHEIAHSLLHAAGTEGSSYASGTKEVEAESVAYTVCCSFGIDTSDYSFPYVSAWSRQMDLSGLKGSLERIRDTSSGMIRDIEDTCRLVRRERKIREISDGIASLELPSVEMFGESGTQEAAGNIAARLDDGRVLTVMLMLSDALRTEKEPDRKERIRELMDRTREIAAADCCIRELEKEER
ncbi:MAG: ImmA/IrrE family metallo-endopeptidase [Oscillospiraceae bacterium]|nr:ImmA/IrrE family metallo-endopeptidase [Oscillospiraceae bacterium]